MQEIEGWPFVKRAIICFGVNCEAKWQMHGSISLYEICNLAHHVLRCVVIRTVINTSYHIGCSPRLSNARHVRGRDYKSVKPDTELV